jgi:hypothetical protein
LASGKRWHGDDHEERSHDKHPDEEEGVKCMHLTDNDITEMIAVAMRQWKGEASNNPCLSLERPCCQRE